VLAPYMKPLTALVVDYLENEGFEVLDAISLEIPDNLEGLLTARIDRLPEEAKYILRVAAVIGRQFPVKVLEYVLSRGL